jgi:hypothetical protein
MPLPTHFTGWQKHVSEYDARIKQCWKTYERRNRELAHLASNLLVLLALLYDCRLICGENLTTLKTEGRGRGVRGRFRNWRNTTTVRGELWRVLRVQVSSVWYPGAPARTARHHPYLPALSSARQNVCLCCCTGSHKSHLVGTVAVLLESCMPVERGTRLCGISQHCPARHGLSCHLSPNQAVRVLPHDFLGSQLLLVYRAGGDAAVAVAGDHTPPVWGQTCLLCRLVVCYIITHISSEKSACSAFYVSTEKVRPPTCVMFGEYHVFATVVKERGACLTPGDDASGSPGSATPLR